MSNGPGRTHDRRLVMGALIVGLFLAMAAAPQLFSGHDPTGLQLDRRLSAPSWTHWLGPDGIAVAMYARICHVPRPTFGTAVVLPAIAIVPGVAAGC